MTEFQIYTLDSTNNRVSVCRDTKDFTHQQGRGKFQVQYFIELNSGKKLVNHLWCFNVIRFLLPSVTHPPMRPHLLNYAFRRNSFI